MKDSSVTIALFAAIAAIATAVITESQSRIAARTEAFSLCDRFFWVSELRG
jgi:hypothetical protein